MLCDIITLWLCLAARNDIATRQFLQYLAGHDAPTSEEYAKLVVLKTIALTSDPIDARQWMENLY